MKLNPQTTLSWFTVLAPILLASCQPTADQTTSHSHQESVFSEYKIVRMHQEDERIVSGSLGKEFENACATLLKEGWIPAGGITLHFSHDDSWKQPLSYTQAFYR